MKRFISLIISACLLTLCTAVMPVLAVAGAPVVGVTWGAPIEMIDVSEGNTAWSDAGFSYAEGLGWGFCGAATSGPKKIPLTNQPGNADEYYYLEYDVNVKGNSNSTVIQLQTELTNKRRSFIFKGTGMSCTPLWLNADGAGFDAQGNPVNSTSQAQSAGNYTSVTVGLLVNNSTKVIDFYVEGVKRGSYDYANPPSGVTNAYSDNDLHYKATYLYFVGKNNADYVYLSGARFYLPRETEPALDTPSAPVWNGNVLSWAAVSGAALYDLYLYRDGNEIQIFADQTALSKDVSEFIGQAGVYTAKVVAKSAGGGTVSALSGASTGKTVASADPGSDTEGAPAVPGITWLEPVELTDFSATSTAFKDTSLTYAEGLGWGFSGSNTFNGVKIAGTVPSGLDQYYIEYTVNISQKGSGTLLQLQDFSKGNSVRRTFRFEKSGSDIVCKPGWTNGGRSFNENGQPIASGGNGVNIGNQCKVTIGLLVEPETKILGFYVNGEKFGEYDYNNPYGSALSGSVSDTDVYYKETQLFYVGNNAGDYVYLSGARYYPAMENPQLPSPGKPEWTAADELSWSAPVGAEEYTVNLYRQDRLLKSKTVKETSVKLLEEIDEAGGYSIDVTAQGLGYKRSDPSERSELRYLYYSNGVLHDNYEFAGSDFDSAPGSGWEMGDSAVSGGRLHLSGQAVCSIGKQDWLPFGGKVTIAVGFETENGSQASLLLRGDETEIMSAVLADGILTLRSGGNSKTVSAGGKPDLRLELDTAAGTCDVFCGDVLLAEKFPIAVGAVSAAQLGAEGGQVYADYFKAYMDWENVADNIAELLSFDMLSDEEPERITKNLHLPSAQSEFFEITWSSTNSAVGGNGAIKPTVTDVSGAITASIQNLVTRTTASKRFDIVVLKNIEDINYAAEATVKSNAYAEPGYELNLLRDGNENTYYRTSGDESSLVITFIFENKATVSRVVIRELTDVIKKFDLEYSEDGLLWRNCYSGNDREIFLNSGYIKSLRITATKPAKPAEIAEIGLFALPTPKQALDYDMSQVKFASSTLRSDFTLPSEGAFGTAFVWTSSNADAVRIGTSETTGFAAKVTRAEKDVSVTLTLTAVNQNETAVKRYNLVVSGTNPSSDNAPSSSSGGGGGRKSDSVGISSLNTTAAEVPQFVSKLKDLDQLSWGKEYILRLEKAGIVNGDENGNCNPNAPVRREQLVKMLVSAIGLKTEKAAALPFDDVDENDWYAESLAAAFHNRLINGVGEREFGAGQSVRREDLCVMIDRAMRQFHMSRDSGEAEKQFADAESISDYAFESVMRLQKQGIISGDESGCFRPDGNATLVECAKMIAEAILSGKGEAE